MFELKLHVFFRVAWKILYIRRGKRRVLKQLIEKFQSCQFAFTFMQKVAPNCPAFWEARLRYSDPVESNKVGYSMNSLFTQTLPTRLCIS